ncbi:ethanolamine utilization protein [Bacillus sp. MUM 116]|uniref:BMC domain-containing protein n=1 Tax=Bacillus sp. MUM 116 TaxID=1678002 RepID=UPI0008F5E7C8|nr:BMC domain-containing protein [Bacillus sp. MUM 116]OIK06619.1 ethanolamine utilization protein [Bacillus sp. MUM 116]
MGRAIGMIETRGLIGSIVAGDAMLKSADVTLVKQEKVDAALVTILVQGDVSAVQAAVDAGKEAAARVGELISAHVIPHPDESIRDVLLKKDHKVNEANKQKENDPAAKGSSKKKAESSFKSKPAKLEEEQ